ncbi:SDR family oxidoreductase [Dictyobacter arantiisoli]|uniref:Short-chain dehydrogenase n=1 Tax=Dictyobacter arantiisoli TaxID=2014874 RepID=A0A5A5TJ37_9CHLR|nr:SDR family oxidoreductase [Dictyobacter arantiisoli]GCF10954.1 short-chain dehydrogenase [Dictyobacter arantiisoli]
MADQNMQGKVCLVTGANGGIGLATARELARQGAHVVMVCRNRAKGEAAQAEIKSVSGNQQVDLLIADISSLASVRQLAQEVRERYPHIHVLINNAGGMFNQRVETADGLETTWALNYIGPVLLTNSLLDILKASAPARIINVSSTAHRFGRIDFDDLQSKQRYRGMRAYGSAKLALILYTYELASQLEGSGVTANCLHPGVVATNFFQLGLLNWLGRLVFLTPEQGAQTTLYLATSPEVAQVNGKYFTKSKAVSSTKDTYDEATRKRLWQSTETLLSEQPAEV